MRAANLNPRQEPPGNAPARYVHQRHSVNAPRRAIHFHTAACPAPASNEFFRPPIHLVRKNQINRRPNGCHAPPPSAPVSLRPIFWVSASSQLAGRGGDPDLEIGGRLRAERVAVDFRALRPGGRAGRGVLDKCEPVRSGPRCSAREQFSEIIRPRHACSEVARVPGASDPGKQAVVPPRPVERVGGEAQQDRLDDRGVVEDCR
jgi:hypothetical protein